MKHQSSILSPLLSFLLTTVAWSPSVSGKALIKDFSLSESLTSDSHALKKAWADKAGSSARELPPPPQYMLALYNSINDNQASNPYEAKVVRSYTDRESSRGNYFNFNISGIGEEESVLEAELHLYIMKSNRFQPHEIRVYQVMGLKKRLIDARQTSGVPLEGWQVFRVKSAVLEWIDNPVSSSQLEFWVTAMTAQSQPVQLRVSRRRDRQINHQPVLVLFNDDANSPSHTLPASSSDATMVGSELFTGSDSSSGVKENSSRQRRDVSSAVTQLTNNPQWTARHQHHQQSSRSVNECRREELYVDFESIGWSEWIIAPKGYNAFHCAGSCSFPLGQSQRPTNHATVQSIVHEMRLTESVSQPCCVPNRLLSLSLLFYDEYDNVVLKQFEEMVADSCGCL